MTNPAFKLTSNIIPIRDGLMFQVHEPEVETGFTVQIEKCVESIWGIVRIFEVEGGLNNGLLSLRNIGRSQIYDSGHAGYLKNSRGQTVAILHIYGTTFRVEVSEENDGV